MKIMKLDEVAKNEIDILKSLDHPNIIKYYDHFEMEIEMGSGSAILNIKQKSLCVVTEFCEVCI